MRIADIKNDDLTYMVERIEPYFASSIIIRGMIDKRNVKEVLGWKTGVRWVYTNNYFFTKTSDQEPVIEELTGKFDKGGEKYARALLKKCLKFGKQLIITAQSIEASSVKSNLLPNEMHGLLSDYVTAARDFMVFQNLILFEGPISKLAHALAKKYAMSDKKVSELLELITRADRLTEGEKEQDDLLRLCINKGGRHEEEEHARKYGWLALRFFVGEPWTAHEVQARRSHISPATAENDLNKRIAHRKEVENGILQAIRDFSREDKKKVRFIKDMVFLRTQRTDFFQKSSSYVQPLVKRIAAHLKVPYDDLLYLSAPEVLRALKGEFVITTCIEKRKSGFVVFFDHEKDQILEGDNAAVFIRKRPILRREATGLQQIIGNTAFKGKARGRVRVIKTTRDNSKVRRGDIIVAIMTTSNFIPALEKASAFITDEGGVTCHAAIIAREMKKPCVIGTKIATQILKDGDVVTVDATAGVVDIVEKKRK